MLDATLNILAAWLGIGAGVMAGVVMGLWFERDGWLGGYGSWARRLIRLGHVSFFGIALLNLSYAMTVMHLEWADYHPVPSLALVAAALLMPAVCFAAAFVKPARHLFALPVMAVLIGVVGVLVGGTVR